MTNRFLMLLAIVAAFALPITAHAQSKPKTHVNHSKTTSARMYTCVICHHEVNAAQAKKLHYICPADHGKLVPVKTISLHKVH